MNERDLLNKLRGLNGKRATIFPAFVVDNMQGGDVVVVEDLDGVRYENVRKRASVGGAENGALLTPVNSSSVLVGRVMDSDQLVVLMVSEVESLVYHGGENGGLVVAPRLRDELAKNNALLDAILTVLSGAAIPEPGNSAPSALQAALASAVAGKELGDFSDIENDKIKH